MYELVTNLNKGWKPPNRHTLAEKLMDECYETVKKKVGRALSDVNWLNFVTDGSDDQAKRRITNLSVNVHVHTISRNLLSSELGQCG